MSKPSRMDSLILESMQDLPERDKREILTFIEFLKIREDRSFIEYVDSRTTEAIEARKRGEAFTSLQELQKEYE
ncbi:MAG: hypothetical protein WCA08_20755 [Desulfoferrobacter sp.]